MSDTKYHNNSNSVNFISVEAEQSVIGGLMLNNAAWSEVSNIISTKDFAQARHQKIFAVMVKLVKQDSPIDPVTVAAELQNKKGDWDAVGGSQYLGHLAGNTPSTANILAYARIVKERCIQRKIDAAYKGHKPGAEILGLEGELDLLRNPQDQVLGAYNWSTLPDADLPEPEFLVDDLITEGVVLLAGAPKTKKSFFALNLGVALAGGGEFMGRKLKEAGVLYLALEDNPRRIKHRVMPMLERGGQPNPDKLEIAHDWKALGLGGEEMLEDHLQDFPDTKLIMIDTLAKLRPTSSGSSSNMYQEDYQLFKKLMDITKKHPGLTILIVHHVRKMKSDDIFESISGSNGIFGSVDSALILAKNGSDTLNVKLHITGRDIEEQRDDEAVVMRFDTQCLTWKVSDEAVSLGNGDDDLIVAAIKNGVHSPKDLADYTGIDYGVVRKRLLHLSHDLGKIEAVKRGYYELVEQVEYPTQTIVDPLDNKLDSAINHDEQTEQTEQTEQYLQPNTPAIVIPKEQMSPQVIDDWSLASLIEGALFEAASGVVAIAHLASKLNVAVDAIYNVIKNDLINVSICKGNIIRSS